jgi:hypothetical protein
MMRYCITTAAEQEVPFFGLYFLICLLVWDSFAAVNQLEQSGDGAEY